MSIQEEYNKQLKHSLEQMRKQKPDHIPVYVMKYKEASKQLIPDLKSPFGLYPKTHTLETIQKMIIQESKVYCQSKNTQFKKQVYLYTIKLMDNIQQQEDQTQKLIKKSNPDAKGYFVKLQQSLKFADAYKTYGRENVLTIVYTDKNNVKIVPEIKKNLQAQKWIKRLLIFILILIVVPMIFGGQKLDDNSLKGENIKLDKKQLNQQLTEQQFLKASQLNLPAPLNAQDKQALSQVSGTHWPQSV